MFIRPILKQGKKIKAPILNVCLSYLDKEDFMYKQKFEMLLGALKVECKHKGERHNKQMSSMLTNSKQVDEYNQVLGNYSKITQVWNESNIQAYVDTKQKEEQKKIELILSKAPQKWDDHECHCLLNKLKKQIINIDTTCGEQIRVITQKLYSDKEKFGILAGWLLHNNQSPKSTLVGGFFPPHSNKKIFDSIIEEFKINKNKDYYNLLYENYNEQTNAGQEHQNSLSRMALFRYSS